MIVLYKVQEQPFNRVQGSLSDLSGILSSTVPFGNLLFAVQQVSPSRAGCTLTHQICDLASQPCAREVAELTPAARDQMESHSERFLTSTMSKLMSLLLRVILGAIIHELILWQC